MEQEVIMKLAKILSEKHEKDEVYTIDSSSCLKDAAKLFCQHRIGALLVKDPDGKYTGIITERDIIKMCCFEAEFYNIEVTELMTEEIVCCKYDDDVDYALKVMGRHKIRHIPVVKGKDIVGVISIGDIIQELYEEDEIVIHDIADMTGANSKNKVF